MLAGGRGIKKKRRVLNAVEFTEFLRQERKIGKSPQYAEEFEHANPQTCASICIEKPSLIPGFGQMGSNCAFCNLL